MRSILCLFGLHNWVRRGGDYVPPPADLAMPPPTPGSLPRPRPTGYVTQRFEQCFRCDKTRWGWSYATEPKYVPPSPQPWSKDRTDG